MERTFKNKARKLFASSMIFLFAFSPLSSLASVEPDPTVPEIISRKTWGADESLMTWPVAYTTVQKFIIHHTASTSLVSDSDGSGQYKSMVNAIYRYHTSTKTWMDGDGASYNGFGDIGYNYVIDPNGNIYEGRAGGNGVVGGHATSFNQGTVGISIIGNYQDSAVGQTNTALDEKVKTSLEKLIGWIAANNDVDVNKVSNFGGKTIDGVVGHKDVAPTQCPGNILYAQLNDVQAQAALYAAQYKKDVYQVQGSAAVYVIGGGFKTQYDSKSDLPATLQSRNVQYISKTQLAAFQYKDKKVFPDGTLLQVKNDSTVYYLENGKKRALGVSEAEFLKLGFKASDIVSISLSDLDYYETGNVIRFGPEGSLISDAKNNVSLIENGRKRAFTSAKLFEYLKYSWTKVKADAQADFYMSGEAMRYPTGTLVKGKDSASVYLIQSGSKRSFTSGALFEKLGYKWGSILTLETSEINAYTTGANMTYPNGTLVRGAGTATVYLVDGGQKREITSATLLNKLGYNFGNVVEIPAASLIDYPTGTKATYPNGTLIKAKDMPAVYRVLSGGKEEFTSLSVFNASGAKWANVVEISPDEMRLYATVGAVKYPDGSLLKASSTEKIYVIKSGSGVWIKTADEFIKGGYKWANVLTIDPAEMKLYVAETDTSTTNNTTTNTNTTTTNSNTSTNTNTTTDTTTNAATDTVTSSSTGGVEPNLRVAITSSTAESVKITASGNYKVEYHNASGALTGTVQKKGGDVTEIAFFADDSYIRFVPESDSVIPQILSYSDAVYGGYNDNKFRGVIELRYSKVSQKLWVIEDVPLEGYLKGISEATTYANAEYLKAFSIITRTYAMNYIKKGGKHSGESFHLKNSRNGNGNDQQYKGYNLEIRSPRTAGSYDGTKGQIIEFKNKPIVAAYSSDSGGVSKDGCVVLTSNYCTDDYSYLRGGVKDPVATVHNAAKIAASHGAGMSAVGALQMAVEGSNWQNIITTYYPGVNINKYY